MKRNLLLPLAMALLFILTCSLSQCLKGNEPVPEPGLPPITQTGENTIGCLINGQVWKTIGDIIDAPVYYYKDSISFTVRRDSNYEDKFETFYMDLTVPIMENSTYRLNDNKIGYTRYANNYERCDFEGGSYGVFNHMGSDGEIFISKIDTNKRFVSGTFAITFPRGKDCDTIKLTEGRFDLHYIKSYKN